MFAERWDRKQTMIAADLLPLLLLRGASQVRIVFAVMFRAGSVQQYFSPAQ